MNLIQEVKFNPEFRRSQEKILDKFLSEYLIPYLPNEFALLHFYWGNHEERGSVRLSSINIPENSSFGKFAGSDNEEAHLRAFHHHVSRFGSQLTLLRWVYHSFLKELEHLYPSEQDKSNKQYSVRIGLEGKNREFSINDNDEIYDLSLNIGNSIVESLWPQKLRTNYANYIYKNKMFENVKEKYTIYRGKTLGILTLSKLKLASRLGAVFSLNHGRDDMDLSAWQFLSALQSAIIYLSMTKTKQQEAISNIDFHCFTGNPHLDTNHESPPMVTLFTLNNKSPDEVQISNIYKYLNECIQNIIGETTNLMRNLPLTTHVLCDLSIPKIYKNKVIGSNKRDEWKQGMTLLESIFHFNHFEKWRECLLTWFTTLICQLHGKIHEGESLGFWFVCGDLSEIKDDDDFELVKIPGNKLEILSFPWYKESMRSEDTSEELKNSVQIDRKNALRSISTENYIWFHEARYALFWDITFPDPKPVGLLRLVNSNWDWFIRARNENKKTKRWPKLAIAYKRPEGDGGIWIEGNQIVSLFEHGKRKEQVEKWVKRIDGTTQNGAVEQSDLVEEMFQLSNLIVRVADNPNTGCCVVFLSESPKRKFIKMGYEWELEEPVSIVEDKLEDIFNLMTMDGATMVWQEEDKWEIGFHFLLHSDQRKNRQIWEYTEDQPDCPLRGKGSRRWSGALAAYLKEVLLVLVVSQDGDILAFRVNDEGTLTMSTAYKQDKRMMDRNREEFDDWKPVFGMGNQTNEQNES